MARANGSPPASKPRVTSGAKPAVGPVVKPAAKTASSSAPKSSSKRATSSSSAGTSTSASSAPKPIVGPATEPATKPAAKVTAPRKGVARAAVGKSQGRVAKPEETGVFVAKKKKVIPFDFVLDELDEVGVVSRPMFGATALYVGEKFVLMLFDKEGVDAGVWLATSVEHHESLRDEFPSMRSVALFGTEVTSWQVLSKKAPDFESSVLRACELIRRGDERIGKIPAAKRKKKT